MQVHYLKAASKEALWQALFSAGLAVNSEAGMVKTGGYDLDEIGFIMEPSGDTNEDGLPAMRPIDGWHANIRRWAGDFNDQQLTQLPRIQAPATPKRVWA